MLCSRQTVYQRERETMDRAEEEEYMAYCNAAMFRIEVLEKRLREHTNNALKKYAVISERLKGDPRLAVLYTSGTGGESGTTRGGAIGQSTNRGMNSSRMSMTGRSRLSARSSVSINSSRGPSPGY